MQAFKTFVVHEKFPYGIDATGLKNFRKTAIEISPDERLMPQDIAVLNEFTHKVNLELAQIWPFTSDLAMLINQVNVDRITLVDDGTDSLMGIYTNYTIGNNQTEIRYQFNQF